MDAKECEHDVAVVICTFCMPVVLHNKISVDMNLLGKQVVS